MSPPAGPSASILPVYVAAKNLPEDTNVFKICMTAERVSGPSSVDGATCISGLWRIHPLTEKARAKLLSHGLEMEGRRVALKESNPFQLHEGGGELPATRLTVSNLPLSYSSDAVMTNLTKLGVQPRSRVIMEKARGPDGSLTHWKTGRRIIWINLPARPLPRATRMGDFMSFLYYREMQENETTCRRCLEKGHKASECTGQEVCVTCRKPGHRRGDPECGMSRPGRQEDARDDQSERESSSEEDESSDDMEAGDEETEHEDGETKSPLQDDKKKSKSEPRMVQVDRNRPSGESGKQVEVSKSDKKEKSEKDAHDAKREDKTKRKGNERKDGSSKSKEDRDRKELASSPSETPAPPGSEKQTRSARQSQHTNYPIQASPQDLNDKESNKRNKRPTPYTSPGEGSNANPHQKPRLEKPNEK